MTKQNIDNKGGVVLHLLILFNKNMITKQNIIEEPASTKVSYYIILLFVFGPGMFDTMRVLDDVITIHSKIMEHIVLHHSFVCVLPGHARHNGSIRFQLMLLSLTTSFPFILK